MVSLYFNILIMGYKSLKACLKDLESQGHLVRVKEEVDPYLEMAAIHLRVNENNGPAIWFENIKGCSFSAASNSGLSVEIVPVLISSAK